MSMPIGPDARILQPGEAWTDAVLSHLSSLAVGDPPKHRAWTNLIEHAKSATASKPSTRWRNTARALVDELGPEDLVTQLTKWWPLVRSGRTMPIPHDERAFAVPDDKGYISETHQHALRGLVWTAALVPDAEVARKLTDLAITCFRKISGYGPRSAKVGNAALWALGNMPGTQAVGQLAVLKAKIRGRSVQNQVAKALDAAAAREGMTRAELEELGVPTHGLHAIGREEIELGPHRALMEIVDTTATRLSWRSASGRVLKSVPAAVKRDFPDELKELKARAKDISKLLPAQRDRLDALYALETSWQLDAWRSRYLDHPIVGWLARRLVWQLEDGNHQTEVFWQDGKLAELGGRVPSWVSNSTQVRLWHPIDADPESILVWRDFIEARGIVQPFKQVYREIYAPSTDEREGVAGSMRFAGHILRQHQFHALTQARGWTNQLRLAVDDTYSPASVSWPRHHLRAELWVDGIGRYPDDLNDAGTFVYLIVSQLRFHHIDSPQSWTHALGGGYRERANPLALEEIPPFVFSEVMRDVDMFVGVSSVANDPDWDRWGREGPLAHYWDDFAFGPLSSHGRTRLEVLRRILPRLSISDRLSVRAPFLVVLGADDTAYEIHIGSGNVQRAVDGTRFRVEMRKASSDASKVVLPFEGDAMLSNVLNKAFYLARHRAT